MDILKFNLNQKSQQQIKKKESYKPQIQVLDENNQGSELSNQDEQNILEKESFELLKEQKQEQIQFVQDQKQNKNNKSLLRLEKDYFESTFNEQRDGNQKDFLIKNILQKQENVERDQKKPSFQLKSEEKSNFISLLDRVKNFIPLLQQENKILLNDPEQIKEKQIDDCLFDVDQVEKMKDKKIILNHNENDKLNFGDINFNKNQSDSHDSEDIENSEDNNLEQNESDENESENLDLDQESSSESENSEESQSQNDKFTDLENQKKLFNQIGLNQLLKNQIQFQNQQHEINQNDKKPILIEKDKTQTQNQNFEFVQQKKQQNVKNKINKQNQKVELDLVLGIFDIDDQVSEETLKKLKK